MPTRFDAIDWYDTPRYYDIVYAEDTEREADFLEAMQKLYGGTRGRALLEPACGSGRLLLAMERRGWRVTGYDANEAMLAYAKKRLAGRRGRVLRGTLEGFRPPGRYDLAHCLVSTFKYVLDEGGARRHLERVAAALKPGGLYALGVHLTDYGNTKRIRERWVGRRGGTHVVCNVQSWPADRRRRVERVRSRLVVNERGRTLRTETNWDFRTYSVRQLRALLRSVPAFEHLATYGFDYELDGERPLDAEQEDVLLILRRALP